MSESLSPLLEANDPKKFNSSSAKPPNAPVVPLLLTNPAPLAKTEPDEIDGDHQGSSVPLAPFPGIDDGFFDERSSHGDDKTTNSKHSSDSKIPEVELTIPSTPDPTEFPSIDLRFGEDDDSKDKVDETDAKTEEGKAVQANRNLLSPSPNNFNTLDFEAGSVMGANESIPDVNIYQHKKTLAQGMMDLALFSANANQLRYVVESSQHPYYYPSMVMITFSLLLQVSNPLETFFEV